MEEAPGAWDACQSKLYGLNRADQKEWPCMLQSSPVGIEQAKDATAKTMLL